MAGSPAIKARLEAHELILEVNDVPVHENDDVMLEVGKVMAGSTIRLKVAKRNGREEIVPVTLAKYYQAGPVIASVKHPFVRGMRLDDTSLLAQRGWEREIPAGVLVREVEKGSQAEAAQLQDAIVTQVDGQEVHTPAEFYEKMRKAGALKLTLAGVDEPVTLN